LIQRAVLTNFMFNVGGTVLPLAASLVTVPIYIAQIGAERYGILAIVWLLLGYFGFLDFGLSRASTNALSRIEPSNNLERGKVIVTALYLNAALGLLGGLILYAASGFLMSRFANLSTGLAAEVHAAMPWVALMLPVALVSGIGAGALESRERFLASNMFQTVGGVLGQVVPVLCALFISPSLTVVIPAALLTRLACTVGIWVFVVRMEAPVNFACFDRARVRALIGYGAWVSVSSLLSPLLETFDQILIGALLGPAAIAHYAVPMSLSLRTQVMALALAKTLFPRLSRLNPAEAKILARRAIVTLSFAFGAVCGSAILLVDPFLKLWVGADFATQAAPVAQILMVGAFFNGIAFLPFSLLQGQGRPDLAAKIHAAEVVPFLGAVYLLTTQLGLAGAALAWTLRTTIDCVAMLRVSRCLTVDLWHAFPAFMLVGVSWLVASNWPATGGIALAEAVVVGLAFATSALLFDQTSRGIVHRAVQAGWMLLHRASRRWRLS
jgi:O-antigen/teichoic acid export membrane protein